MRAFVLILAAAIFGAASLSSTAASGRPAACNETCLALKRVLADRTNGFANLKGTPKDSNSWPANVTVPGLSCHVSEQKFTCYGFHLKMKGERELAAVLSAFRKAEPGWKWYGEKDAEGHSVYGGPEKGNFIASIQSLAPPPGAEINKDQFMFTLVVDVAPQPIKRPLKRVRP